MVRQVRKVDALVVSASCVTRRICERSLGVLLDEGEPEGWMSCVTKTDRVISLPNVAETYDQAVRYED